MPLSTVVRTMTDEEMKEMLRQNPVCRLATSKEGQPYVVPLNFVYHKGCFYVHIGEKGQTVEYLKGNSKVCLQADTGWHQEPYPSEAPLPDACTPCLVAFQSIIAFGKARILTDRAEKYAIAEEFVKKYAIAYGYTYKPMKEAFLDMVLWIEIEVEKLTGKQATIEESTEWGIKDYIHMVQLFLTAEGYVPRQLNQ